MKFNEILEFNILVNLSSGDLKPINEYVFLNLLHVSDASDSFTGTPRKMVSKLKCGSNV